MERLPYIDEHSIPIGASPERVWRALLPSLRVDFGDVSLGPLRQLLGLAPNERRGEWRGSVRAGDALPGFAVVEARPAERLELRGHHRFSRYALVFVLEADAGGGCTLRAQTWAAFPGLAGRSYRALVIGSRGHRLLLRRLLRNVGRRA